MTDVHNQVSGCVGSGRKKHGPRSAARPITVYQWQTGRGKKY